MVVGDNDKTAVCKVCGKEKPLGDFYIYETAGRLYASSLCKQCKKERVRMIYYLRNKGIIRQVRKQSEDEDADMDGMSRLFDVRDKTVYARLIWFDGVWHDEFTPVLQMDSVALCYRCLPVLKDLSVAELKDMRTEFLRSHPNWKNTEKNQ